MKLLRLFLCFACVVEVTPAAAQAEAISVSSETPAVAAKPIAAASFQGVSVSKDFVTIKLSTSVEYNGFLLQSPPQLVIELFDTQNKASGLSAKGKGKYLANVGWGQFQATSRPATRVVLDLLKTAAYKIEAVSKGLTVQLSAPASNEAQAVVPPATTAVVTSTKTTVVESSVPPPATAPAAAPSETMTDQPITLNLQSMPLTKVLGAISRQTGTSFIVGKELENMQFTVFLNNVTVKQALRALLEAHNLGYEQVGGSNTYVIKALSMIGRTGPRLLTHIYNLHYVQLAEGTIATPAHGSAFVIVDTNEGSKGSTGPGGNGAGAGGGSGGGNGGGGGGAKSSGSDLITALNSTVSQYGHIQIYPPTNSLIVTDIPEQFPQFEDLLSRLDAPVPQVLIEVQLVETSANTARNIGLDIGSADGTLASFSGPTRLVNYPTGPASTWTLYPNAAQVTQGTAGSAGGTASGTGITFGLLSFQELTAVLHAVETEGTSKYLARPKIMTLNNKAAEVAVTADTAVGIQSSSLIAGSGLLTTTADRTQTGVTLKVTPQINSGDSVTLLIDSKVTLPQASQFFPTQFVDSETRSINTSVRIKDGMSLMIGGLLSDQKTHSIKAIPILSRIPLLGALFRYEQNSMTKDELLIFITPRIVR